MTLSTKKVLICLTSFLVAFLFVAIILLGFLIVKTYYMPDGYNERADIHMLEVTIPQGKLRGIIRQTYLGRNISAFLGVPFAEPPLGPLRFEPPRKPSPWNGTLVADTDHRICPQWFKGKCLGIEDCLRLNLFTPNLPLKPGKKLFPTIVYVFGGGFKQGDRPPTVYNQWFLLDTDVVLVVPNYRLGPIGFISTGDEVVPGNNGNKDLVRALEWVKENIEYFGGDPNQVTLFGHSSGAASAHDIALSPLSKGLFRRYMTMSATGVSRFSFADRRLLAKRAFKLGAHVGCLTNDTRELIDCLTKIELEKLILSAPIFYEVDVYPSNVWAPTNEPDLEGSFLTDSPMNLVASGKIGDLPWVFGVVENEGMGDTSCFYDEPDKWQSTLRNLEKYLPYFLNYDNHPTINVTAYTNDVMAYYFSDMTVDPDIILANLTDAISDGGVFYPAWFALQQQVALASSPTYFYMTHYRGKVSYSYMYCNHMELHGVAHGEELLYLFEEARVNFPNSDKIDYTDVEMKDKFVEIWRSFATDGVPRSSPKDRSTAWEPYDPRKNNIVSIGNGSSKEISIQHTFRDEQMRFWAGMKAKYGY